MSVKTHKDPNILSLCSVIGNILVDYCKPVDSYASKLTAIVPLNFESTATMGTVSMLAVIYAMMAILTKRTALSNSLPTTRLYLRFSVHQSTLEIQNLLSSWGTGKDVVQLQCPRKHLTARNTFPYSVDKCAGLFEWMTFVIGLAQILNKEELYLSWRV
eukprot:gene345-616_t